jgi:hypothetical protein
LSVQHCSLAPVGLKGFAALLLQQAAEEPEGTKALTAAAVEVDLGEDPWGKGESQSIARPMPNFAALAL